MKNQKMNSTGKTIVKYGITALLIVFIANCFGNNKIMIVSKFKSGSKSFKTELSNSYNQLTKIK
jgi:hypothetical protein